MKQPLTKLQENVLKLFFENQISASYFLTGGTALAGFYLHHRKSVDLDLFTLETIDTVVIEQALQTIAEQTNTALTHPVATTSYHQFYLEEPNDKLKIEFVKDIPVQFGKVKMFDNIRIDSIENIGSNKITAIFGRTEAKDFIDLYFLLKKGLSFERLLEDAKKKDLGLTEFYLANMLFEVKNLKIFPEMLVPFDKQEMETYFVNLANQLLIDAKPAK